MSTTQVLLSFLALAPELRNKIYTLLYAHPSIPIQRKYNSTTTTISRKQSNTFNIHPAFLATCKQIHNEASSILYSANIFKTRDPKILLAFLSEIGTKANGHITKLHLVVPWNEQTWNFWPTELFSRLSEQVTSLRTIVATFEDFPTKSFHRYGVGEEEEFRALVRGQHESLEMNLGLALRRLRCVENVVVDGVEREVGGDGEGGALRY